MQNLCGTNNWLLFFFLFENDPEILFSNFKTVKNPLRNSLSFIFQGLTP